MDDATSTRWWWLGTRSSGPSVRTKGEGEGEVPLGESLDDGNARGDDTAFDVVLFLKASYNDPNVIIMLSIAS